MEIQKKDGRIHILWEFPIQVKTSTKNEKQYHEYRVTVPPELVTFTSFDSIPCDDECVSVRDKRVTLPVAFVRAHGYTRVCYDLDTGTELVSVTFS